MTGLTRLSVSSSFILVDCRCPSSCAVGKDVLSWLLSLLSQLVGSPTPSFALEDEEVSPQSLLLDLWGPFWELWVISPLALSFILIWLSCLAALVSWQLIGFRVSLLPPPRGCMKLEASVMEASSTANDRDISWSPLCTFSLLFDEFDIFLLSCLSCPCWASSSSVLALGWRDFSL